MNLDDYKFVYKPSISIIMREFALDFRIAALGIKLAGHTLGQTVRRKFPSGGRIGVHNNFPEYFAYIDPAFPGKDHTSVGVYSMQNGRVITHIIEDEARFISSDALRRIIGRPNKKKTYGYWLYKPTIWQRIKSIFK